MPPAPVIVMAFEEASSFQPSSSAPRGEPLVPLLRAEQGLADPDVLATWHSALSHALSTDIPHDLLGLWLYPAHGGQVLIGPEALAQDELPIPIPSPQIAPAQVAILEAIVRDAGYGSVVAVPIRSGRRDVGLILAADLRPGRYQEAEQVILDIVAQRLAPTLGRMARLWGTAGGSPDVSAIVTLVDAVAHAGEQAGTPQLYVAELSRALESLLPHDHLELLLEEPGTGRTYRLGEHAGGALWADPSLVLEREALDLDALFGQWPTHRIGDTYREPRWPRGYFTVEDPAGAELRSGGGARTTPPQGVVAYLLASGMGADLYDEGDAALLGRVGRLVAAQVALLVKTAPRPPEPPAPRVGETPAPPSWLDAAELLATGTDFAETMRRVSDLAATLLPYDTLRFAIRLTEGDRVVLLEPGERRPLPDLPLIPVAGTTLAAVLAGELPHAFALVDGEARLVVPLRVTGRVHGALVLTAHPPAILREVHLRPAQQLADIVASHLELLRRTALLPPPYLPGWKKTR